MSPPAASVAVRPPPTERRSGLVAWTMLAVFALTLTLSAVHNDFPASYHPDEPSKVEQVLTGQRNYHHPPLMLTLTLRVMRTAGISRQPANIARTGRFLSAFYVASAAALLAWLAGVYGGPGGAICAAAALGTNAQGILAGHFFKEDALFALTLALTFCAGTVHWRRRTVLSLLALGASAGLAVSSKYLGTLAVLYAFALAALAAPADASSHPSFHLSRWRAVGLCALGTATIFLWLNASALFDNFHAWRQGIAYGVAVSAEGNHAVGTRIPHLQFVGMFFLFTPLPVLVGAVVFWSKLKAHPFRAHADRWLAGLSPLWLLLIFSFSASTAVRYFLPISLMLDCVAGVALPACTLWALTRWRRDKTKTLPAYLPTLTAAAVLLLFNLPGLCALLNGFAGDDRASLRQWITQNLPPSAVIVQDGLAQLPGDTPLPQRILSKTCAADFGDLATLRAQGITHVLVCWYDSRRFVDTSKKPAPGAAADFERRRTFYLTLREHAHRLWRSDLRQPYPLRPGLELFALDGK